MNLKIISHIFVVALKKTRTRKCILYINVGLVVLFLLWFSHERYQNERSGMLRRILQVIGSDRNTSVKLLPGVSTTILQPSHGCQFQGQNALAIVLVTTMAESWKRRDIIRTTWASKKYETDIMIFFFSGKPTSGNFEDLEREADLHGDLIIEQFDEDYYGLAIKTLRMLKWFQMNCPKSKFLIKADDDVYLNLHFISTQLKQMDSSFKIGGRVLSGRTPNLMNPFSKWYTPSEIWPSDLIPPDYLGGPCYFIRGDVVPELLNSSCQVPLYHLEDVFLTGMVANQKLGYELTSIPGTFDPKYPSTWYSISQYFSDVTNNYISSLHTDGDFDLMRRVFMDLETTE